MAIILDPKGFYWAETEALNSLDQRRTNARYIRNTCITDSWAFMCPGHENSPVSPWTLHAIAAFLGNVRVESWINPGLYQGFTVNPANGYGLVQWTPGTLLLNWANGLNYPTYDIDVQLARLQYESDNNLEWYPAGNYTYIRTFQQFITTTQYTYWELTGAFWVNYLRSAASSNPDSEEYIASLNARVDAAEGWYDYLTRTPAEPPWRPSSASDSLMYYYRRQRRF